MNNEQRRQVRLLSIKYFSEFGRLADGSPRFQWMRTDKIKIDFARGFKMVKTQSGFFMPSTIYQRRTLAETTGHGLAWIIAKFVEPVSRQRWELLHGTAIPWPRNGHWEPMELVSRQAELIPNEEVSALAANALRTALELSGDDILREIQDAREKKENQTKAELGDLCDSARTAFLNDPGGKSHVSFPSVKGAS
jgi:hypothetical protein